MSFGAGHAADRDEQLLALGAAAVVQLDADASVVA